MRISGSLILLLALFFSDDANAQVSDLRGMEFRTAPQVSNELDITTALLGSPSYPLYVNDLPTTKRKNKAFRDYTLARIDTFFVRNILNQSTWFTMEATLVDTIQNYAIWIESNILEELQYDDIYTHFRTGLRTYLIEKSDEYSVNPSLGLIELLNTYVGDFPNSDNDDMVDILFLDIIDQFETTGQFVAGFFDPVNLSLYEFSNKRDMVYMDIYPTLIQNDSLHLRRSLSTLVHELQHLIHAGYEGDEIEDVFINEGFSEAVEILCGFPPRDPSWYLANSFKSLLSWEYSNPIVDYARASLWTHYLVEQYGTSLLKHMIQNKKTGIEGYHDSIIHFGGLGFEDSFKHWGIANTVNNRERSEKYGYLHPLLTNFTMPHSGETDHIPTVISGTVPPLSHALISIPYVRNVQLQKSNVHDEHINLTGILSYPRDETNVVHPFFEDNKTAFTNIDDFGSVRILLSNNSPDVDTTWNRINILVEGEQSAIEKTIGYGDGVNDTFYSNATFLKLSNKDQKLGIILPKQNSDYWLKSLNISAVFESELMGNSQLSSTERDFKISIYTVNNARIHSPILDGIIVQSQREPGQLVKETFTLEPYFELLSNIRDTIAIVIENDLDDDNFISIGLDYSQTPYGIVYNNEWLSLGDISIGGHSLNGFTPNINITIIEKGHQTSTQNLIQSVDYNFEKVLVDVAVPIGFEHPEMSLISQLPDGSFHKYEPVDTSNYLFTYEIPVQVDGTYTIKSVLSSSNPSVTITDEIEWNIDLPNGITINQNYPNPFNPTTSIPFTLLEQADVGWNIYDILGRNIRTIEPRNTQSGEHIFELDLSKYASGVYFVRAIIERERTGINYTKPIKVLMIK